MPHRDDAGRRRLRQLQDDLRTFRDERDWRQFHTPSNLAAAVSIEAAELQEIFLWSSSAQGDALLEDRRAEIEDEVADVLIQLLNFADIAGVDPLEAAERKLERNRDRFPVTAVRGRALKAPGRPPH